MTLGYTSGLGFEEGILAGTKIHSIREDKHRRWRPGMSIQHVMGNRTKQRRCFLENECTAIQRVRIIYNPPLSLIMLLIDGRLINGRDKQLLTTNDGFPDFRRFRDWFGPLCKTKPPKDTPKGLGFVYDKSVESGLSWDGVLIHWTDYRY